MTDEQFKRLIREIRFSAILSGVIAKRGPSNGDGNPAVGLVDLAARFVDALDRAIEETR